MDNAIKYAPAGGRIRVRVANEADGATLEVSDTGPGILPERQHRIFDRFYRGAHDHSGESSGVGLGLAIAMWAVEANLGTLSYEPAEGGGAAFRITLPRSSTPAASMATADVSRPAARIS